MGRPVASIVSSSSTGMPCSGPRAPLVARSRSSVAASDTARVFSERTACSAGPFGVGQRDPRQVAPSISVSDESVPAVSRSCSDFTDSVSSENGRIVFPPASAKRGLR